MFTVHPEDVVSNVSDIFALFESRWAVSEPAIFRGEPARFQNYLCPSAFRAGPLADEFDEYEHAFALYKKSSTHDYMFDRLFPGAHHHALSSIALLQHYGTKTRLLDVTFSPLIALYFATLSHPTDDGYMFLYFGNYLDITSVTSERSLLSLISSKGIGDYSPSPDTLLLYRPEWHNSRSAAQSGAFIFTKGFCQNLWGGGGVLKVPAGRKLAIQSQLRRFGVSHKHLFPI